jgi:hypothetical protein
MKGSRRPLPGVLNEVAGHLGCGIDDGVEVALLACCLDGTADDASGHRVAALDGCRGQEQLAYQRTARCQISQRRRVQMPGRRAVIAGGQGDPGQQQATASGVKPAS